VAFLLWIALGFFVLVVAGGSVYVSMKTLEAWRAFRSLRRSVAGGLDDMVQKVADVEDRLVAASGTAARLDAATSRLHSSLAHGRVLAAAAADVRASLGRGRATVPRK
jgi:hypothetical protein